MTSAIGSRVRWLSLARRASLCLRRDSRLRRHSDPRSYLAPAFTGRDLTAAPTAGWSTNGGDSFNRRYSPLTQINRDNVASLKAVWRTRLNGSGVGDQVFGRSAAPRL